MYLVWFGLAVSLSPVLWHTGSASRLLGGDSLKEYLGSSGRDDRKQEEVQDGGAWIPPPLPAVSPLTSEPRQLGRINSALTQQKKQSRAKDPLLEPSLKRAERSLKSHSWDPSHSASPAVSASPRVPSRWSLDGRKETEKEKESDLENPYVQALSRGLGGGEEDEGEGGGDFGENSSGSAVLAERGGDVRGMSRRLSGSQAVKYLGRMGGDLGQMATRLKDLSQKVQLSGSTYWGLSPADKEVLQELPRDEDALLDLERSLENAQKVVDERGEKSKSESSQLSALRAINTKLLSDQKATDATTKAALEKANSQRDIATDLVASFKTDLRKSKKENAELTKALEQKETALKETQENLSHLTFELSRSSTDADSLRARLATVKKQMESIKADDAAEARDVVEREKNFSSQIQKMTAETKSQKQQLKDLTEENAMTASRLSDSQTELNRLQHKTQEDAEGRAVLEATIEKADREKSKLQKEVVELKRKETEEKEEGKVKQKEREEQTARKEEDNLKRQKLNMQAINTAAASAEDRAKAAEAALSEERDEHQREIASKNRQLSSLHSELSSLQAELTSLAAQFHKDHPHTSREPDSLRPPRPVLRRKHHTTPIHPNYTHTKLINDKPNRPLSNEEQQPTVQVTQKVSADTPLPAHASPETHTEQVAAAVPRVPVKKEKEGVESVEEGKEKTESLDSAEAALQNAVGSSGRSDPPPAQEGEGGGDGSSPSAEPLPSVPSVSTPQLDHPSMALHKMIERERGQEGKHRGSENTLKNVSPKQIIPAVTDKSSVDVAEGLVGSEDRGKGGGRLISGPFGKVWAPRGG